MHVRGIRGAISVRKDTPDEVLSATKQLLLEIVTRNQIEVQDIASIYFTVTQDLISCFPAAGARELGWTFVPLLCSVEIPVIGSDKKLVKVLMHVNTLKKQEEIIHIYLKKAKRLRPDLSTI
ncbi:chorismate mutase [Desulfitibacter alkalitolerans]|uniref:chorismate mutase n=1 Tax=Desulfitibacter alkalitolerans TaxID=264641 RepID=UPI000484F7F4|nr:chorismate mutase [Desulfitibacter alkalitolerans]